MNPYESDRLLAEYLLFHYGSAADLLGDFPGPSEATGFARRLVSLLLQPDFLSENSLALDLGCAVGGSSFALSESGLSVLGIDFSSSFVEAARELCQKGEKTVGIVEEGERIRNFAAKVPRESQPEKVRFAQGDAMQLPMDLGSFDVVLAANLLCRLPEPVRLLSRLPNLVRPGGQLLLTTPFTWLEEFTPKDQWIGGREKTGESASALKSLLEEEFELDHEVEIPFLIREHRRKFQYSVAWGTRWIRKKS